MARYFFFTRMVLFPPLDKRNIRDKAKGLRITSEGYIGELGVRCLSSINRGQDSRQQSHIGIGSSPLKQYKYGVHTNSGTHPILILEQSPY